MKKKIEPLHKPKALFGNPNPPIIVVNEPKIIVEPKNIIEDKVAIVKQSEIDGWISIYQPDAANDRFVLLSPDGKRFACKFYRRLENEFIGQSLLSMYSLKEHFDRTIIPEEEGL